MSRSARATEAAGAAFARTLVPGDCVRLLGPLGAGKTTFVRGALRALRVAEAASSPTFVLAHEAWGRTRGGVRVRVAHLDCYRLAAGAAEGRGLLDYLDGRAIVYSRLERPLRTIHAAQKVEKVTEEMPRKRQTLGKVPIR
ncbi:MAG: tRNA (adenosine(37)-N6)-threonylcarbamoyltransferase complex ATPase subunit type 1 TsaE, partial [bacterium]